MFILVNEQVHGIVGLCMPFWEWMQIWECMKVLKWMQILGRCWSGWSGCKYWSGAGTDEVGAHIGVGVDADAEVDAGIVVDGGIWRGWNGFRYQSGCGCGCGGGSGWDAGTGSCWGGCRFSSGCRSRSTETPNATGQVFQKMWTWLQRLQGR